MVRISNLVKNDDFISFNYYCENNDDEKGFFSFDLLEEKIIESKLAPMEIKKTTNPKSEMASAFDVLDKDIDKKRGIGVIICRGTTN